MMDSSVITTCTNRLSRGNQVTISWVPGHEGIEGNEKADELAKKGADSVFIGPEPVLGMARATYTFASAFVVFAAEIVGTAILMFLGCMGGVGGFKDKDAPSAQCGVIFGLTVASIIQMLGHVSGAHLNPAVTLASWLWGTVSLPIGILYFVAQMIGAIAGFYALAGMTPERYLLWGIHPNDTGSFCTTTVAPGLSTSQAFVGEFLATSILIFMCCGCWDTRNKSLQDSVAIKFGGLVAAISVAEGPYTGASMNPARTFAPSIYFDIWDHHWVYWVAPLLAGFVVPIVYKLFFMHGVEDNAESDPEDVTSYHPSIIVGSSEKQNPS